MPFVAVLRALPHALSRPQVFAFIEAKWRALTAKAGGEAHSYARKGTEIGRFRGGFQVLKKPVCIVLLGLR